MKYDFLRLELSTPYTKVGNVAHNISNIRESIDKAISNNSDLIVLPRLAVTSASCGDMIHNNTLLSDALDGIATLVSHYKNKDIIIVVGTPFVLNNSLLDCACIIHKGNVLGLSILPSIDASQVIDNNLTAKFLDQLAPIGNNIYTITTSKTSSFSFAIVCDNDDALHANIKSYDKQGVSLLINMSSSFAYASSHTEHMHTLSSLSKSYNMAIASISNNCKESAYGNVYSGDKIICEYGDILAHSTLDKDISIATDVDIEFVEAIRVRRSSLSTLYPKHSNHIKLSKSIGKDKTIRILDRFPFVSKESEFENILDILACGVHAKMSEIGLNKVVFGLSGGIDSTMVLLICDRLCKKYNIPHSNILTITMRGLGTSTRSENNAFALAKIFKTTHIDINISSAVKGHLKDIAHSAVDIVYENAQARERAQILLDLSNKYGAVNLGTGDLSEIALGWSTYGGDALAHFNPNTSLTKSHIRALVMYLSQKTSDKAIRGVLSDILSNPISPELVVGQDTESLLGPYDLHDFFLYHFVYRGHSVTHVYYTSIEVFNDISPSYIKEYFALFLSRFFKNLFKKKYACDGIQLFDSDLSRFNVNSNFDGFMYLRELGAITIPQK